MACW
jgi:hypothetical protein